MYGGKYERIDDTRFFVCEEPRSVLRGLCLISVLSDGNVHRMHNEGVEAW